jgi:hypothetical protein
VMSKNPHTISKKSRSNGLALPGRQLLLLPEKGHAFPWLNRQYWMFLDSKLGHLVFLTSWHYSQNFDGQRRLRLLYHKGLKGQAFQARHMAFNGISTKLDFGQKPAYPKE